MMGKVAQGKLSPIHIGLIGSPYEAIELQENTVACRNNDQRLYACVYGNSSTGIPLADHLSVFSPLVEETTLDTVLMDVTGTENLFGSPEQVAEEILAYLSSKGLDASAAVGYNADSAILAARNFPGITILAQDQDQRLSRLPLNTLDPSLAGVKTDRAEVILETLGLWGLHTLGDLANLPEKGVAETLGPDGLTLRRLAKGIHRRPLNFVKPKTAFEESLDLEYPIELLDHLSQVVSSVLDRLCSRLVRYGLATTAIKLEAKLENKSGYDRHLRLPFAMSSPHWISRLLLLEVESDPPQSAILSVSISAEPAIPRRIQKGLFEPLSPEPEKLDLTLSRLGRLIGGDNIGSPGVLNDHHPDTFCVKAFELVTRRRRFIPPTQREDQVSLQRSLQCLRIFRPALKARVESESGRLRFLKVSEGKIPRGGRIMFQSGPWKASGRWWSGTEGWGREEWEVTLNGGEVYRIFQAADTAEWYVEGIYD
jgi:protein ImuB